MMSRLCLWLGHCFGRITPERTRKRMLEEAKEFAQRHDVLTMEHEAIAARAAIDARHHAELSHHFQSMAVRLSSTQRTEK